MNLSELLAEQGELPLTDKVGGVTLRAFINASFKRVGVPAIDKNTPSEKILETIYGLDDDTVREQLLNKKVSDVKGSLNYKRILSITAVMVTVLVLGFFSYAVRGGESLSSDEIDLIKAIGSGAFDLLKEVFGKEAAQ